MRRWPSGNANPETALTHPVRSDALPAALAGQRSPVGRCLDLFCLLGKRLLVQLPSVVGEPAGLGRPIRVA
jgi:hypothetical protein